jgi:hypothetical protein
VINEVEIKIFIQFNIDTFCMFINSMLSICASYLLVNQMCGKRERTDWWIIICNYKTIMHMHQWQRLLIKDREWFYWDKWKRAVTIGKPTCLGYIIFFSLQLIVIICIEWKKKCQWMACENNGSIQRMSLFV